MQESTIARRLWLSLILLALSLVSAVESNADSLQPGARIQLQDEGTTQGPVNKLNCTGTGVTCSVSGTTGTINATGGTGSFAITEAEIDFGDSSVYFDGVFTVTDAAIASTHKIIALQSGAAATGRDEDENEMDSLELRAVAGTGQFTLYVTCYEGCHGKFKVNYTYA